MQEYVWKDGITNERPEVETNDVKVVDSRCHALTAPHVREKHQTDNQVNMFDIKLTRQIDAKQGVSQKTLCKKKEGHSSTQCVLHCRFSLSPGRGFYIVTICYNL